MRRNFTHKKVVLNKKDCGHSQRSNQSWLIRAGKILKQHGSLHGTVHWWNPAFKDISSLRWVTYGVVLFHFVMQQQKKRILRNCFILISASEDQVQPSGQPAVWAGVGVKMNGRKKTFALGLWKKVFTPTTSKHPSKGRREKIGSHFQALPHKLLGGFGRAKLVPGQIGNIPTATRLPK